MICRFVEGDATEGSTRAVVSDVYRDGRSLFDPAIGCQIEIMFHDYLDNYIGTARMKMSLAEAIDLKDRLAAFVDKVQKHQPLHQRYE